jgi:NTP pyrophosphatase (non-canonical NTP hydrolase)
MVGKKRTEDEIYSLIIGELSEAIEASRDGYANDEIYYDVTEPGKHEGVPVELADCVIRIMDYTAREGIDIGDYIINYDFSSFPSLTSLVMECHQDLAAAFRSHGWCDTKGDEDAYLGNCISTIEDWLKFIGVDLEEVIRLKMEYNKTRPYKHGKKF